MSEILKDSIFYAGEYTKPLDDKRRLTVPAKWRFRGDDADNSYLAVPNSYGAISVLPPDMVTNLYEKISKISLANAAKRKAISKFLSKSDRFGCDKQGRIVLSENLVAHAQLTDGEVYMVGAGASFEIWNPEKRASYLEDDDGRNDDSILEELGI